MCLSTWSRASPMYLMISNAFQTIGRRRREIYIFRFIFSFFMQIYCLLASVRHIAYRSTVTFYIDIECCLQTSAHTHAHSPSSTRSYAVRRNGEKSIKK